MFAGLPDGSYSNKEFDALRASENKSSDQSFAACERGWTEQRLQLNRGVAALKGKSPIHRVQCRIFPADMPRLLS